MFAGFNNDSHFPAKTGDFRLGCDDGTWFNRNDVRLGLAPALGPVRRDGYPYVVHCFWRQCSRCGAVVPTPLALVYSYLFNVVWRDLRTQNVWNPP
jgi:hypothetical protein